MSAAEVADVIARYADAVDAPVQTHTDRPVRAAVATTGTRSCTDQGTWTAPTVVLASGACNRPSVPAFADGRPAVDRPRSRRWPTAAPTRWPTAACSSSVPAATGVQLADEIHRSGPPGHARGRRARPPARAPTGAATSSGGWTPPACSTSAYDEVDDITRARHVPSPQLVGIARPAARSTSTPSPRSACASSAGSAASPTAGAVRRLAAQRLRAGRPQDEPPAQRHRRVGGAAGLDGEVDPPQPTRAPADPGARARPHAAARSARSCGRRATGPTTRGSTSPSSTAVVGSFHDGGVVSGAPGVYLLGTPFLRRRRSSFISGADHDTRELADHLHRWLDGHRHRRRQSGAATAPDGSHPSVSFVLYAGRIRGAC